MRVMALGLRAVPGVAGGIETHCEHLYSPVVSAGCQVELVVRSRYASGAAGRAWRGARIKKIWSPRGNGVETIVHTLFGVLYAGISRPDILHLHALGPAIYTPLARLLGLKVVVTHHGSDYERAKWGPLGKLVLRTGERMAMRFAHAVISVSSSRAAELRAEYHREVLFVPNGVPAIDPPADCQVLAELGLEPGRYVLHVGRSAPEKRQDDLIEAFRRCRLSGWRLVIVGDMTGSDTHSRRVRELAESDPRVILAGFRQGDALRALLTHAGCFALPSTIEGFSIALLEALSAGCPVIASDIPANHEVELPAGCYFDVGDIEELAECLWRVREQTSANVWRNLQAKVRADFGWPRIAAETVSIYRSVSQGTSASPAQRSGQDDKVDSLSRDGKSSMGRTP